MSLSLRHKLGGLPTAVTLGALPNNAFLPQVKERFMSRKKSLLSTGDGMRFTPDFLDPFFFFFFFLNSNQTHLSEVILAEMQLEIVFLENKPM